VPRLHAAPTTNCCGRVDPTQPFSFAAVTVLKGQLADPHVDLFADSTTRRQLDAHSNWCVLLVHSKSGWVNLGVADEGYQKVVGGILAFSPEWARAGGGKKRLEYFLSLWSHENRAIFEQAYLELGKAPYSAIKKFGARVSHEELQPILTQRDYLEWRALAVLMLAQRDDESARRRITEAFENCARFSLTTNLSAWATAYVEIHKAQGVAVIERAYLKNEKRSLEEIRSVLTALAVHSQQGDFDLRERIIASYGRSVHPKAADAIQELRIIALQPSVQD
jgi:hypothetical protein